MVNVIPLEYLSSGSFCSVHLAVFGGCRLAASSTWLKRGSRLLAGLVGGLSASMPGPWFASLCWGVRVVSVGCAVFISWLGTGEGIGDAVLSMSSMQFTLAVLDLVFLVGAGDGEMGGEGESSPKITGIDRRGGPAVLLALQGGGGAALCACG